MYSHHLQKNHYVVMFFIMFISGLLSTMNVFVDKWQDIRFSLNDLYMTLLMTGWMFLFMGMVDKNKNIFLFGLFLVLLNIWCIRTQIFISQNQYKLGMIPHHSMAIHMSKKLLEKENTISSFLQTLIHTQEKEIEFLKN